jgi:protein adenylyltransferase
MVDQRMTNFDSVAFQNSYRQLGENFYSDQRPTPVSAPELIRFNDALAQQLNLPDGILNDGILKNSILNDDNSNSAALVEVLAGNRIPLNSSPIATVYAAHQFGGWNPQLGDGRAILLGEVIGNDNKRYDIQLKGAGRTPYSRMGDGRSALGPVLREYILCEAMAALNIPTTRALAAVSTGDQVVRESMLPGAIFTRVAQSHIRIGTFQFFSARNELASVKALADHVIDRHYQSEVNLIQEASQVDPYTALLSCVIQAQARLIAQWMSVGFIHGVMNTDNMLVCGETVDYGPCAFMDHYNPNKVFSSIDHQGRYAYSNQPDIGGWNLSWLAQALLPLMDDVEEKAINKAQQALTQYTEIFDQHYQGLMAKKLGFVESSPEVSELSIGLLEIMEQESSDYTLTFRALADQRAPDGENTIPADLDPIRDAFQPWLNKWRALMAKQNIDESTAHELMARTNPAYIPRNHWVEAAIEQGTQHQDFSIFHQLVDVLSKPFEYQEEHKAFAMAPTPDQEVSQTFCGT